MTTSQKNTVTQLLATAQKLGPQYPDKWRVTALDDIAPKIGSDYLIKGLIDRGHLVLIYGESGSGKTFFTVDLALRIATGTPWRGRRMSQGLVMYLAVENPASVRNRVFAWRNHHKPEKGAPFIVVETPLDLQAPQAELEIIEAYQLAMKHHKGKPGAIVIDTFSRAMPGGDENSPESMTRFVGVCDRIKHETGAAVIVVHHSGKDRDRGARGHSSLKAAVDVELMVHDKIATATKVRDGEKGREYPFSLDVVKLGSDSDGDEVVTCVLLDQHEQSARPKKLTKPTGKNQLVVYDAIRDLIREKGQVLPETSAIPAGTKAVTLDDVIQRAGPKMPVTDPKRRRERIATAIEGLQDQGIVSVQDPHCWIVR